MVVWVLYTLLVTSCVSKAYRILVVFPYPVRSHGILGDGVVRHLLSAGHEVSYITPFPQKKPHPRLTQIDVSSNMDHISGNIMKLRYEMKGEIDMNDHSRFFFFMNHISSITLEHENVVKIFSNPKQHFDLVIAEWMYNELYAGLAPVFNAPFIWFSSKEPHWMILSLIDEYLNPSYDGYHVPAIPPFTFSERLYELWFTIKLTVLRKTIIQYLQNRQYKRLLVPYIEQRGRIPPSFQDVKFNASLILGNSHVSMGQATRIPQSYKPIGGYHIEDNTILLPEDLKKLMDESQHGVIYFSMGSNLKSKNLPDQLKTELLQMFGTLNQTVLWKFEETMRNLPKNVHILKWAPQQSILSHKKCLTFITHGGLLSTTEAIHTGVPIIGIPVFADQFTNVKRAVNKGFAIEVMMSYSMVGALKKAIDEIISDPKYRQKIKELSFTYHDRPVKPGAELVHWAEHVIKTGGAPHLRSPALLVPWYQKIYLDLIILLAVSIYVLKKIYKYVKPLVYKVKNEVKKKN